MQGWTPAGCSMWVSAALIPRSSRQSLWDLRVSKHSLSYQMTSLNFWHWSPSFSLIRNPENIKSGYIYWSKSINSAHINSDPETANKYPMMKRTNNTLPKRLLLNNNSWFPKTARRDYTHTMAGDTHMQSVPIATYSVMSHKFSDFRIRLFSKMRRKKWCVTAMTLQNSCVCIGDLKK